MISKGNNVLQISVRNDNCADPIMTSVSVNLKIVKLKYGAMNFQVQLHHAARKIKRSCFV